MEPKLGLIRPIGARNGPFFIFARRGRRFLLDWAMVYCLTALGISTSLASLGLQAAKPGQGIKLAERAVGRSVGTTTYQFGSRNQIAKVILPTGKAYQAKAGTFVYEFQGGTLSLVLESPNPEGKEFVKRFSPSPPSRCFSKRFKGILLERAGRNSDFRDRLYVLHTSQFAFSMMITWSRKDRGALERAETLVGYVLNNLSVTTAP